MNVLPVILDLSPSIRNEPTGGGPSPSGEFARLLDRTISGSGGSIPRFTTSDAPSLSPTKQPAETRQRSSAEVRSSATEGEAGNRGSEQPARADRNAAARPADHSSERRNTAATKSHTTEEQHATGARKKTPHAAPSETKAAQSKNESAGRAAAHGKNAAVAEKGAHSKDPTAHPATKSGSVLGSLLLVNFTKAGAKQVSNQVSHGQAGAKDVPTEKPGAKVTGAAGKAPAKAPPETTVSKKPATEAPPAPAASAEATKQTAPNEKTSKKKEPAAPKKGSMILAQVSGGIGQLTAQIPLALGHAATDPAGTQNPGLMNTATAQTAVRQDSPGYSAVMPHAAKSDHGSLTIIDLRQTSQNKSSTTGSHQDQGQQSGNVRLFQLADGGSNAAMRLGTQAAQVKPGAPPVPGQSFSGLADQIVKQTGILLRSNNSGEIRLVLQPENLGNLRIKIDMNNNNLTGKILVQNHDALRLIQQNLDSLYRALRDSGFTATALNVSVGGREDGEKNRERSTPLPSMRKIAGVRGFDNQVAALETAGGIYSLVNLVI